MVDVHAIRNGCTIIDDHSLLSSSHALTKLVLYYVYGHDMAFMFCKCILYAWLHWDREIHVSFNYSIPFSLGQQVS